MSILFKAEYHHDGTNDLAAVTFCLMEPDRIENGRRVHRIFCGWRHDRFDIPISFDDVYTGLGLIYGGPEKPAYDYELWYEVESEPCHLALTVKQLKTAIEPVEVPVTVEQLVTPMITRPNPMPVAGSEVLMAALEPFAHLGSQLKGLPFKDYEPFPGTVSVGWLREAARALGRDA